MRDLNPPRLISIADAAEFAAVNPRTIRRRIEDGSLTGFRFGGVIRVDLRELEAAFRPIPTVSRIAS